MIEPTRRWAAALVFAAACTPERHPPADEGSTSGASTSAEDSQGTTTAEAGADASSGSDASTDEGTSTSTSTGSTSSADTSESSGGDESTGAVDPVQDAIERGIAGASTIANDELVMQIFLDVMHRRHSVEEFSTAAARYDEIVASVPDPPVDAIAFRRILDSSQLFTAEQLEQIAPGVNEVTVPAMFCDILPLAPEYATRLESDAALGGYELTHVVIALEWMHELGCTAPVDAAFVDQVILDDFALIDTSDGLTDLELEAAIFGTMLAGPELLPPDLLDALLAGQLADGTWPHTPGLASGAWHATGLGLMLLLELHRKPQDGFLADTIP